MNSTIIQGYCQKKARKCKKIKDDGTVVWQTVSRNAIKEATQTIVDNIEPKIYPNITAKRIKAEERVVVKVGGKFILMCLTHNIGKIIRKIQTKTEQSKACYHPMMAVPA